MKNQNLPPKTSIKIKNAKPSLIAHSQIAMAAYELYVNDGCKEGCDEQYWLEAEKGMQETIE